eukprot:gene14211-biopygen8081
MPTPCPRQCPNTDVLLWGKRQRARTGRGPDAGRTMEFEGTDADRTRAWPFLPLGSQEGGAGVARAWRGRGAGYRHPLAWGGADMARAFPVPPSPSRYASHDHMGALLTLQSGSPIGEPLDLEALPYLFYCGARIHLPKAFESGHPPLMSGQAELRTHFPGCEARYVRRGL